MDITISVPDRTLANVIISGLTNGIGYWCDKARIRGHKKGVTSGILKAPEYERYFRPIQDGSLVVRDSDTKEEFSIGRAAFQNALVEISKSYPHHLKSILSDNTDMVTGDILIQVAVFGEIPYG